MTKRSIEEETSSYFTEQVSNENVKNNMKKLGK